MMASAARPGATLIPQVETFVSLLCTRQILVLTPKLTCYMKILYSWCNILYNTATNCEYLIPKLKTDIIFSALL